MDPSPAPPAPWVPEDGEEWELRHDDDGFTYKILKRMRLSDPTDVCLLPPAAGVKAKEDNKRERKRKILLKLKARYQEEIRRWEVLSSRLRAMQERPRLHQEELRKGLLALDQKRPDAEKVTDDTCGTLIDELLSLAETQELMIRDVANLCEVAEVICNAQQEQFVTAFIDLPVWSYSPQQLIAALCDE